MEQADSAREDEVELWKAALDEDDALEKLSETELGYASHVSTSMGLDSSQRHEQLAMYRLRNGVTMRQRFKRKNFSKQLQLLCLQRYAQYARDFGHLPEKDATQQILQQSYLQFLKEGGTTDEPRLTYAEFLKLIRNRRREIHARAQLRSKVQIKDKHSTGRRIAVLTPAKRKLQEEHAKIRDFIEVIDKAREQGGVMLDTHHQKRRFRSQEGAVNQDHALQHESQHLSTVEMAIASSTMNTLPSVYVPPDAIEPMDAILQIYLETREVQREIMTRLRSINRVISQHENLGEIDMPSSASV